MHSLVVLGNTERIRGSIAVHFLFSVEKGPSLGVLGKTERIRGCITVYFMFSGHGIRSKGAGLLPVLIVACLSVGWWYVTWC